MAKSIIAPSSAAASPQKGANFTELQSALHEADMLVQDANAKIEAAARSICLMLREPDSGFMRLHIKALCDMIEQHSLEAMNAVNYSAEQHGANYTDDADERSRIYAAVRAVQS